MNMQTGCYVKSTNVVEIGLADITLLFSYKTLVAVNTPDGLYITNKKYSATTTRHINKYTEGSGTEVEPEQLELIVAERMHDYYRKHHINKGDNR